MAKDAIYQSNQIVKDQLSALRKHQSSTERFQIAGKTSYRVDCIESTANPLFSMSPLRGDLSARPGRCVEGARIIQISPGSAMAFDKYF
jgi:hypothetical protein